MDKKVAVTDKKNVKKREKNEHKNCSYAILVTVWVAVALFACMFAANGFLTLTKDTISYGKMNATLLELMVSAAVYATAVLVTVFGPWLILRRWPQAKTNREEMGLRFWPTWTDILLAVAGYVVSLVAGMFLLFVGAALLPGANWEQAQDVGFHGVYATSDLLMAFVALVVVAPICEELIFRGWMYGKLRARLAAVPAILLVSLLFAAVHMQLNVGVVVFCMSVVNCLIRELTGTIYGGIFVHMLRNAVAFYALFVMGV